MSAVCNEMGFAQGVSSTVCRCHNFVGTRKDAKRNGKEPRNNTNKLAQKIEDKNQQRQNKEDQEENNRKSQDMKHYTKLGKTSQPLMNNIWR